MASKKRYSKEASSHRHCVHCFPDICCCTKSTLNLCKVCGCKRCICKPKCKSKCELELLNLDASKDVTVTQGDLELEIEQGDVSQNNSQGQSGSNLGDQTQTNSQGQSGSTLGDLTQTPTETQTQTMAEQTQNPTETQTQTLGEQTQNPTESQSLTMEGQTLTGPTQTHTNGAQTTGAQTLQANPTNNSSADVSQTVSGVTVNVPVTLEVSCGCEKKKKHGSKDCYKTDDCCAKSMGDILNQVRILQPTFLETIDLYLTDSPSLAQNPIPDQTITNVDDCATVSYATGPIVSTPSSTAQLCKVAGFSSVDNGASPNLFQFLTNYAATCTTNTSSCGCREEDCYSCSRSSCKCNACANGIGDQLRARIGTNVNLTIDGAPDEITDVTVLNVCECLAFFTDASTNTIYVFSLCSIVQFTPVESAPPAAPPPVSNPGTTCFETLFE